MIRGRVVCIIKLLIVSIWSDLLRFVDDLCQILGMFSLNSIGCVTKCGPAGILEGNTKLTDVCKANVLKSSYRKI